MTTIRFGRMLDDLKWKMPRLPALMTSTFSNRQTRLSPKLQRQSLTSPRMTGSPPIDNGKRTGGKLMKVFTSGLAVSLLLTTGAYAQVSPAPAPAQAMTVAPVADNVLRTGTEVQLKLSEPLSTKEKKLRVGQHFQLSVLEAVSVGGNVVIPVGSPAVGEITEVRNKGMWGKSGHLTASLLHVSVNGRQIRLNGTFDDKGVTGTAGVVAAVAFVPVVGFFTTGTSAQIDAGTQIKGFVGEDVPLVFGPAQTPKPLEVPVAVPAAPAAAASAAAQTSGSAPNQK